MHGCAGEEYHPKVRNALKIGVNGHYGEMAF